MSFTEGSDPYGYNASSIVQASDGNFYITMGTTPRTLAGDPGVNAGGIVQVTPGGQLNLVHAFALDGSEGNQPQGPLVEGPDDYLYGTTNTSDAAGRRSPTDWPSKFSPAPAALSSRWGHCRPAPPDGPSNVLFVGSDGNLYGTSVVGGNLTAAHCAGVGCGMLFRMTPRGTFSHGIRFSRWQRTSPNTPPLPPVDGAGPGSSGRAGGQWRLYWQLVGFDRHQLPGLFRSIDLGGSVNPPVSLTVSPSIAGVSTPVTVGWTVSNAF